MVRAESTIADSERESAIILRSCGEPTINTKETELVVHDKVEVCREDIQERVEREWAKLFDRGMNSTSEA